MEATRECSFPKARQSSTARGILPPLSWSVEEGMALVEGVRSHLHEALPLSARRCRRLQGERHGRALTASSGFPSGDAPSPSRRKEGWGGSLACAKLNNAL